MPVAFDNDVLNAIFTSRQTDGSFSPEVADYLTEMGRTRPSIVLAFAPKAAGTFLRSAAIAAADAQLVRTVDAQAGRDAQFHLPIFLLYYAGGFPARPLATHVHMQALPGNIRFIEALDLKPVIMVRAIPDMLVSYLDMLEGGTGPQAWLNLQIPPHFADLPAEEQGDFIIDMLGPWYASYFATWLDYARANSRVLVLDYDQFRAQPLQSLESLLLHSRFAVARARAEAALEEAWEARRDFRFNQGVSGRGAARFTPVQLARLRRMLEFYPALGPWMDRLIPPPSASSVPARPSTAA